MAAGRVRFGVVGTNWITGALIDAGRTVPEFDVVAVVSRSAETGSAFADRHGIERVHTSIQALGEAPDVDAAYIASPNSLHGTQSIELLRAGKHVLTEKPLGASATEVAEMTAAASESGRLLMEAYVAPFEPNVAAIREALPQVGTIRRVVLTKDQYSSRYDAVKAGELPNAFNPRFAAGSLMDLAIYPVALSRHLFGPPAASSATGRLLPTGVDGQGTILLQYDGFEVICIHSKIVPGGGGSWIAGEDGVITFDDCSVPSRVEFTPRDGPETTDLTREQSSHHMRYEVEHFVDLVLTGRQQSDTWPLSRSADVLGVLDRARAAVGVVFPAD